MDCRYQQSQLGGWWWLSGVSRTPGTEENEFYPIERPSYSAANIRLERQNISMINKVLCPSFRACNKANTTSIVRTIQLKECAVFIEDHECKSEYQIDMKQDQVTKVRNLRREQRDSVC